MGIDAKLENESGRCLAQVRDPKGYVNWLLSLAPLDDTACLKSIDAYGDTVFNLEQMPVLRLELEHLAPFISERNVEHAKRGYMARTKTWPKAAIEDASRLTSSLSVDQLQGHLDDLIALVSQGIEAGPHHYCRFVGD
jgi:hypothetical protein